MNELMAIIDSEDWIYWKTKETNVWDAWDELKRKMESIDINIDNFYPCELILRNVNGEDIDNWEM